MINLLTISLGSLKRSLLLYFTLDNLHCIRFWSSCSFLYSHFAVSYFSLYQVSLAGYSLFLRFHPLGGLRFYIIHISGSYPEVGSIVLVHVGSSALHLSFHLRMYSCDLEIWTFDVLYGKQCLDFNLLLCIICPCRGCFTSELHLFFFLLLFLSIYYRLQL